MFVGLPCGASFREEPFEPNVLCFLIASHRRVHVVESVHGLCVDVRVVTKPGRSPALGTAHSTALTCLIPQSHLLLRLLAPLIP